MTELSPTAQVLPDGSWEFPPTQRPDGTFRKPERRKPVPPPSWQQPRPPGSSPPLPPCFLLLCTPSLACCSCAHSLLPAPAAPAAPAACHLPALCPLSAPAPACFFLPRSPSTGSRGVCEAARCADARCCGAGIHPARGDGEVHVQGRTGPAPRPRTLVNRTAAPRPMGHWRTFHQRACGSACGRAWILPPTTHAHTRPPSPSPLAGTGRRATSQWKKSSDMAYVAIIDYHQW